MIILYIEEDGRRAEYRFKAIHQDLFPLEAIETVDKNRRRIKMKTGIEFKVITIGEINRIRGLDIAVMFLGVRTNTEDRAWLKEMVRGEK